ncbi:hypothetical protein [Acetobacter conturbans]|uniref:Uncharacterized protein n=1 Tax=Acetobacter conturbans TaxID=1737472 RepID=A0ABX0K4D1_9PROT|nr:hypothetical protein [Acetobacter conturbans]NHN89989.1 hypothetical protein [Acetobacter conturbans]
MDINALPPEIAAIGRTSINEWTVVWSKVSANPCSTRRTEIERELRAMLCAHQAGAQFVFRAPAGHESASAPLIIDEDYSVVEKYGADPQATENEVKIWAHGQCALLAARMHELSGWPILQLGIDHFLIQRPDGALVDAYGVHVPEHEKDCSHLDEIVDRYEAYDAKWKKGDCDSLCSMTPDEDRAEADEFLKTPWMLAVFPKHHRLGVPLSYMAIDDRPDDPCDEMED